MDLFVEMEKPTFGAVGEVASAELPPVFFEYFQLEVEDER